MLFTWISVCKAEKNLPPQLFYDLSLDGLVPADNFYRKVNQDLDLHTVEPVLSTLINHHNMKRVNSRGMPQANKHVLMAALAYNLKKYLRFVVKKPNVLAGIVSLKQGEAYTFLKTFFYDLKNSILSPPDFTVLDCN